MTRDASHISRIPFPPPAPACALAVCFTVEASQLHHSAALDALRRTTIGHLALGSGFDPRDFAAYAGGVALALMMERALSVRRPPGPLPE